MPGHGRRRGRIHLERVAALLVLLEAGAAQAGPVRTPSYDPSFQVRITEQETAAAVRRAIRGAFRKLAEPECQRVFSDFTDPSGRTLKANLDALGRNGQDHLGGILFYSGEDVARCSSRGISAVTSPGSRAIHICGREFVRGHNRNPTFMEAIIIHEALHSLGLGEDPPTSAEITARVFSRCRK